MTQALKDFFAGGVEAAKFEDGAFGTVVGGVIVDDPRMTQQRDYTTGDPISYPDGNPAMQMVVTVQAFDAAGDDDGRRAFYIKGQMKQAVGEALRKAGAEVPERGGTLQIKYVEDKPTTLRNGKPGNPQKIYVARYIAPAKTQGGQFFDEPAARPAPAVHAAAVPPALACPPGVDPGKWAAMSPAQREQMYDALGLDQGQAGGEPPF